MSSIVIARVPRVIEPKRGAKTIVGAYCGKYPTSGWGTANERFETIVSRGHNLAYMFPKKGIYSAGLPIETVEMLPPPVNGDAFCYWATNEDEHRRYLDLISGFDYVVAICNKYDYEALAAWTQPTNTRLIDLCVSASYRSQSQALAYAMRILCGESVSDWRDR